MIVAGAGPVGLFLAAELRRGGVSVAVIEQLAARSEQIKAASVGPQSAELFDQRGLLGEFLPLDPVWFAGIGTRPFGHFAGLWVLRGAPEIRTPPVFAAQAEVEAVLERHARELGAMVLREHQLCEVRDDGDTVVATAETPAGRVELSARYLVGCDGGRSVVRRLGGFDFPGTDPTITGRQALVDIAEPNPLEKGWHRTEHGMIVFGPGPSRVLTVEFDGPPGGRDAPLIREEIEGSLQRVSGTDVRVTALHKGTRWTDNTRQATKYRRRRLLLAGDAAHVHPPFGGQGLNLGLQDAANLGWKLAAGLQGHGSAALLDSYHRERWPSASAALENTRAQIALMRPGPQVSALRELFAELLEYDDANQHVSRLMTGVDLPYPMDSEHQEAGRVVADRAVGDARLYELLRAPGGLLLDGSVDARWSLAARGYDGRLRVLAGTPGTDSLLIRPDGIVAWGAEKDNETGQDQLVAALRRWFGEPTGDARSPGGQ